MQGRISIAGLISLESDAPSGTLEGEEPKRIRDHD